MEILLPILIGSIIGIYIGNVTVKYLQYKKTVKAYEEFIQEIATEISEMKEFIYK